MIERAGIFTGIGNGGSLVLISRAEKHTVLAFEGSRCEENDGVEAAKCVRRKDKISADNILPSYNPVPVYVYYYNT